MKSNFEQTGGSYIEIGDYFLPTITLPKKQGERFVGVWGQRKRQYL